MTVPPPDRLQRLFEQARALPPLARAGFVDTRCGNDAELKQRLRALLAATGDVQFGAPTADDAPTTSGDDTLATPLHEGPGTTIGPYKLLQQIGEGGFGATGPAKALQLLDLDVQMNPSVATRMVEEVCRQPCVPVRVAQGMRNERRTRRTDWFRALTRVYHQVGKLPDEPKGPIVTSQVRAKAHHEPNPAHTSSLNAPRPSQASRGPRDQPAPAALRLGDSARCTRSARSPTGRCCSSAAPT